MQLKTMIRMEPLITTEKIKSAVEMKLDVLDFTMEDIVGVLSYCTQDAFAKLERNG